MEQEIKISNIIVIVFVAILSHLKLIEWYYAVPICIYLVDFKLTKRN